MRKKEIKVEWCEAWIKAKFAKLASVVPLCSKRRRKP